MIVDNITQLIGKTPMVRIKGDQTTSDIYLKLEMNNPTGSVKARAAKQILDAAITSNKLKPGMKIVEPTSGNTGIALAMLARQYGYEIDLVMPESFSVERRDVMKAYGANVVLTSADLGMTGAINKVAEMAKADSNIFVPNQFDNEENAHAHYLTTAVEIEEDLGPVDCFVIGVGTAGTIIGLASYFKERYPDVLVVAVEPTDSPAISQGFGGKHKIQGIGPGFIAKNYKSEYIDRVMTVSNEEAKDETIKLCQETGIFAGISTGSNMYIAKIMAKELGSGKKIVTVAPDSGDKYLSTGLFK